MTLWIATVIPGRAAPTVSITDTGVTPKLAATGNVPLATWYVRVANSPVPNPVVLIRANWTDATLVVLGVRSEPALTPLRITSDGWMVSPAEGFAVATACIPPISFPIGNVPLVASFTVTVVGWLTNGTLTVLELTAGVPAEALTDTLPTTVLLSVTEATPLKVFAVADDRVPLPLMMENVTGVLLAMAPFTVSTGVRVAVRVTGV